MANQRIEFLKGTHYGYKFDAAWKITQTKPYTLPNNSGANSDGIILKLPEHGNWPFTKVVDGIWAGFYVPLAGTLPGAAGSPLSAIPRQQLGTSPEPPKPEPEPEPPKPEPEPPQPGEIAATPANWIAKWAAAQPGQTIRLAAGTYSVNSMDEPKSGTQGKPITIAGGPGVVFDGNGTEQSFRLQQAHDLVLKDFTVEDFRPDDTGVFNLEGCYRMRLERIALRGNLSPSPTPGYYNDHGFYLALGCRDIELVDCSVDGGYKGSATGYLAGAAVHCYHAPGPVNVRVSGGTFTRCDWGVMWTQAGSNNLIENADLRGNRYGPTQISASAGVTLRNNRT